ncbi:MAG: hypothetical protein C5B50_05300 [Verrucomicrobia bacterium]|nr:MAG: hypothetical protein C5B50_05300 [Verrucomicrobiota bacterium]
MELADYRKCVEALPFGKRLPGAVYVLRGEGVEVREHLEALLDRVVRRFQVSDEFNVIKFRTDELKVSFLSYPGFFRDGHPALRYAITVDLVTGRARHTDYSGNANPPILHRKETLVPAEHPRRADFEALTKAEEEAGLYEETATIGFRLNWERLLESKGLAVEGHKLQRRAVAAAASNGSSSMVVERHKTALTRYELSKPVKSLLEYGVLRPGKSFFDYGCGQGSDMKGLRALGYEADGWDPVFRPDAPKREADIANFGYVLNVIEDPAERVEALVDAFRLARRVLVVSGLINETVDMNSARRLADGVLTRSNTFQKFFEQQELHQYIEDALEATAVPVALGVFYVFRDPAEQQDFLSARSKRAIDWTEISTRLGLGCPKTLWRALYQQHKELLDGFGKLALELGRMPGPAEFQDLSRVTELLGSLKRALRAFVQGGGVENVEWDAIKARFGVGQPVRRRWEILCEENRELLEAYWELLLQLGRLPEPEEFARFGELRERIGSAKQAMRLLVLRGGSEEIRRSAEVRQRDLLVYVALANLRKKVPFGHLSKSLRWDVRAFFGNYTRALKEGLELLYAAGDVGEIELACEDLKTGWQDEQALYLHRRLLNDLPPVLRAYVGCAAALFGDVAQADVIKLHKASGKVTFLVYDDFDGKALPELRQRIKVNLRTRWVQVFDHSAEGQVLEGKHRFLACAATVVTDPRC